MVYTANWAIICYLPPIKGTRKLHWQDSSSFFRHIRHSDGRSTSLLVFCTPGSTSTLALWGDELGGWRGEVANGLGSEKKCNCFASMYGIFSYMSSYIWLICIGKCREVFHTWMVWVSFFQSSGSSMILRYRPHPWGKRCLLALWRKFWWWKFLWFRDQSKTMKMMGFFLISSE